MRWKIQLRLLHLSALADSMVVKQHVQAPPRCEAEARTWDMLHLNPLQESGCHPLQSAQAQKVQHDLIGSGVGGFQVLAPHTCGVARRATGPSEDQQMSK